jgi:hypothetical protein
VVVSLMPDTPAAEIAPEFERAKTAEF